jgi:aspartate racemase
LETNLENPPTIGIIGGVGPYAGLDFFRKILLNTRTVKDQDHLNCILVSCSTLIPDRTEFLLSKEPGKNPALGLFTCAETLHRSGARYVSVACNTAHADRIFTPFCNMVKENFPDLVIVNMLETCATYVKTHSLTRIGLLATLGTYKSKVYHEYFKETDGCTLLEPESRGQEKIHESIYSEQFGIKAYSQPVKETAKQIILNEIDRLWERGAEAVILGCTELPLAIETSDTSLPLLDPGLLTARKLIELVAPEKLLR